MAEHLKIADALDLDIYFCDPASPWQRGSNENTNGLLRQYFPKGSDLSGYHPTIWHSSPPNSTNGPARPSAGKPPQKPSSNYCQTHPSLRRPPQSARYTGCNVCIA